MEDKSVRSRRSGLDKSGDLHGNIHKVNSELCYDDSLGLSQSTISPEFQHKLAQLDQQAEKDCRSDDCRQSNNSVCRSKDQKQKDHKAEVHRLAEYVCGDWSEHVSSSGKHYYYNCKTEVSQWEKPKEWNDMVVIPSGIHAHAAQQTVPVKATAVSTDVVMRRQSVEHEDGSRSQSSYNTSAHQHRGTSQSVLDNCTVSAAAAAKLTVNSSMSDSCSQQNERRHIINSVDSSSHADSCNLVNSHRPESSLPVCIGGIYGLVSSTRDSSSTHQHNGSKGIDNNLDIRMTADEDMDISPGSTPTEESLIEKRISAAICGTNLASTVASVLSPMTGQLVAEDQHDSGVFDANSTQHSSISSATFLSTLASLQNALHLVTPTGNSSLKKTVPPSALSLLASLPSLVNQLQEAEQGSSASKAPSQSQQADQQHIMQQVIQMLQRLQQALVAQQQQQQQRQLQELLLQLLNMQKHGTGNNDLTAANSLPPSQQHGKHKNNVAEGSCENAAKFESPYSPPDSDGTPLGSPENHCYGGLEDARRPIDVTKGTDSPKVVEQGGNTSLLKQSPERNVAISPAVIGGSGSMLIVIPGSVQSTGLVGTSHLAAGVHRKQHDSIGLTPTLANYVNHRLTDHIAGWQTDALERQVNCYSEDSNSFSSLHCTQISVDLKQARSLVRLNEIQTTLQEQRVMFIRQQTKDLENMRSGYAFQTNVQNVDT